MSEGVHREAWLVAARGGWWTPYEIISEMPSDCESSDINNALWAMVNRHKTLAVRGEKYRRQYAVTAECKVPPGVPVGRLMEALGVGKDGTA